MVQAREEAERLRAESVAQAREEAREEARRVLAQQREAFEAEQQEALADAHSQIVSLVLAATRKVVGEGIDERMQRRMIDRFLSEMEPLGEVQ
jgi:F-type H+-transporting ATPase subunit b